MKSKIVLFSMILFLTATGTFAQPGCSEPFNPFYICWSNFERYDHFFYGEVISIESLYNVSVNSTYTPRKAEIKVKESFKGKLPEKITLYLSGDLICSMPSKGNRYLFYAVNSELDGQKVYFSERVSRSMTDYSPEAVKEVFANIRSIFSNKKKGYIEGTIFENLLETREVTIKTEDADRLSRDFRRSKPATDVLIELISESDGKVYQTKSIGNGSFRIDSVPNGFYKFNLYLPPYKETEFSQRYEASDTFCSRTLYLHVTPKRSK